MDRDSHLLFEAYGKSRVSYTPVNSDYIYFLDDQELYQTNPMKRIGTGEKYLKQAFPNGYKKVRVTVGEEIHDVVPGNNIDLGTQSDKLFVVDDTFPEESSFPALISSPSENAEDESMSDTDFEEQFSESWDPMTNLAPKAQQIHDILSECGDDELTPEQCEKAADIIIGGSGEWEQQDYIRMLKGLSFVLQKMCIRSMN